MNVSVYLLFEKCISIEFWKSFHKDFGPMFLDLFLVTLGFDVNISDTLFKKTHFDGFCYYFWSATDYCTLIFCLYAYLLLFLTIYSLEIFILLYVLCIICNKWQLCFFWSYFYSIYLPCFIQLAQTSNVILNRNSNRKHLCLFQILKWRILITYYWISCLCMKECCIIEHERLWGTYIKMIYTFQLGILNLCSLANLNFLLMIFSLVILVL